MTDADEELLKWAGASVLGKLKAIEGAIEVEAVIEKNQGSLIRLMKTAMKRLVTAPARRAISWTDSEQKQVPQRHLTSSLAQKPRTTHFENAKSRGNK